MRDTGHARAIVGRVALVAAACIVMSGCSGLLPAAVHQPCWTEERDFTYVPTTLEGLIEVDMIFSREQLTIVQPNGRRAYLAWPEGFTESYGAGMPGRASSQFGLVVAQSGQRAVLWGALIPESSAKRPLSRPGADDFIVCEVNGVAYSPPPDLNQ